MKRLLTLPVMFITLLHLTPGLACGGRPTITIQGTTSGNSVSTMTSTVSSSDFAYPMTSQHGTWSVESAAAAGATDPAAYSSLNQTGIQTDTKTSVSISGMNSCKTMSNGGQACYSSHNHTGTYRVETQESGSLPDFACTDAMKYFGGAYPFVENFILGNPADTNSFDNGMTTYSQSHRSGNFYGSTFPQSVTTPESLTGQPLIISCSEGSTLRSPFVTCAPVNGGVKLTTSEGGELTISHLISKPMLNDPTYISHADISEQSTGLQTTVDMYIELHSLLIGLSEPLTVTYSGPTLTTNSTYVTFDIQSSDSSVTFPSSGVNITTDIKHVNTCTLDSPTSVDFKTLTGSDSSSHELAQKTISLTASCDGEESDSVTGSATIGDLFRIGVYAPGAGEWADPVTCSDGSACIPFTDDGGVNNTGLVINNTNGESVINRSDGVQLAGKLADTSNTGGTSTMDLNLIIARLQDGEQIKAGVHTARAVIKLYYN